MNDTNTTTKPGVLAELDALIERNRLSMRGDSERALIDIRATVERLAEDAEALLADLELDMATSHPSSFRLVRTGNRVAFLRAALAAFRGDV